ncbi:hypothetical protein [Methylobacterium nonmethylotrophicum]|uniref:hypothetical protein n=1 Tax=Methylobacterium nonmethylotrophicum TaxID=1141884 RepID=UPI00197B9B9A|nr:hypothetical protein [Methylobacterium nonmethylotrophicum]
MASPLRDALIASAQRIGANPLDLATVISYETGGTFSPSIRGGAGNRHIGLIQFGPAEQRDYGASQGQSFEEQLGAAERYLQARGFQPGMGILDLYSTINAGRPGRYNASDAGNGGAPGTVADKVNTQMGAHRAKAAAFLGGDFTPTMPAGTNEAPATPFGFQAPKGDAPAPQSAPATDDTADVAAILRSLMPKPAAQEQPTAPAEAPAPAPAPQPQAPPPQFDAGRFFALLPATGRRRT